MRSTIKLVVLLCVFITLAGANGSVAHALSIDEIDLANDPFGQQAHAEAVKKQAELEQQKVAKEEKERADKARTVARSTCYARSSTMVGAG